MSDALSTRITEAELLQLEAAAHDGLERKRRAQERLGPACPPNPVETIIAPETARDVAAEIRRYRALLLGLELQTRGTLQVEAPYCPFCRDLSANADGQRPRLRGAHHLGCVWSKLEAEIKAIRAEMVTSGHRVREEHP